MPTSIAAPTTATALIPRSRSAMSSQVPSNADIVILSNTASRSSGATSGLISIPALPRRNQGWTSSTERTRCHAIAMRSWKTPIISTGSERWRE